MVAMHVVPSQRRSRVASARVLSQAWPSYERATGFGPSSRTWSVPFALAGKSMLIEPTPGKSTLAKQVHVREVSTPMSSGITDYCRKGER